jgi:hypothetical protein
MDWFYIVSKKHDEYVKIVRSFPENQDNEFIEDIVQETYIWLSELGSKKHKKQDKRINENYKDLPISKRIIKEDNQVNMFFMWIALKRTSMLLLKKELKRKQYIIRLGAGFEKAEQLKQENENAFNTIINKIEKEILSWHWYDKMLFETYMSENKSMRKLSEQTGISLTSVFNTLKNCKKRLKQNIGEDYTDYLNKDFELIK